LKQKVFRKQNKFKFYSELILFYFLLASSSHICATLHNKFALVSSLEVHGEILFLARFRQRTDIPRPLFAVKVSPSEMLLPLFFGILKSAAAAAAYGISFVFKKQRKGEVKKNKNSYNSHTIECLLLETKCMHANVSRSASLLFESQKYFSGNLLACLLGCCCRMMSRFCALLAL